LSEPDVEGRRGRSYLDRVDSEPPPQATLARAVRHVDDILAQAIEFRTGARALLVADGRSALARLLLAAYRRCLPGAEVLDFDAVPPAEVHAAFERLVPRDLVVLIQSTSFRLDAYRIRLELFRRGLCVIEHPHLARMVGEGLAHYVDALAYDPAYYRGVGGALKQRLDRASTVELMSGGERLVFAGGLEPTKLNVGDYRGARNVGGQFPIGEVFTEARELGAVNGRVRIAFFGDAAFEIARPEPPITLVVERGRVTRALDSTRAFDEVLENIRADEGEILVREFGCGLNRALTPRNIVNDVGTFERMCGVHLSLGAKHASYKKPGVERESAKHHVDVFPVVEAVLLDGQNVFVDGEWRC